MKVGDLVRFRGYIAMVICDDDGDILIKWLDDGEVENADNYIDPPLELVSEHR